jgi:hypothetical protein
LLRWTRGLVIWWRLDIFNVVKLLSLFWIRLWLRLLVVVINTWKFNSTINQLLLDIILSVFHIFYPFVVAINPFI